MAGGGPRRGQIYRADFGVPVGSEQGGERPCVVVSNDTLNQRSPVVVVATITRTIPTKNYPHLVQLAEGRPLQYAGTIQCNQLRTISGERLLHHMADLDDEQMDAVSRALKKTLRLS